ncbi:helix-turn-helix domain-containing protein [Pseudomonas gingeri]|uniref:Helix-turn-helix transcriptional regulator n=1 Tax=Pseudomonas gingeri TaxID=117681 RepID=A0A7Y7YIG6_9PSED|nr:helix-turn-helix transcriptional regulator [Pseudomonas gingeri]NWC35700.1 helix-turn-helix transcriptional regulator [Pseudomonas gingeri]
MALVVTFTIEPHLISWRMALAKSMLQGDAPHLEGIAGVIGYQSASAFSTAFRREVGESPSQFVRNKKLPAN